MGMELRQALQIPATPNSYEYEYETDNNTGWMVSGNLIEDPSLNLRGSYPGLMESQQNLHEYETYTQANRQRWRGEEAGTQEYLPAPPRPDLERGMRGPVV